MFKKITTLFILSSCYYAHSDEITVADDHAPISIMSDHMHKKNEFMFSYRLSSMVMSGLSNGTSSISIEDTMTNPNGSSFNKGSYMNAPVSMNMSMHMFGMMYAPSDYFTFLIMSNYQQKEMTQQRMKMSGGARFNINSHGFGDLLLGGMFGIKNNKNLKMHLGFGLSFPTGSISKKDQTPMGSNKKLGYSMQNGSGTYDPYILLNILKNIDKIKYGAQFFFKFRPGDSNKYGYKYGNFLDTNIWTSYNFIHFFSSSLKISFKNLNQMKGQDDQLNSRMSPAMDAGNIGYTKVLLGLGFNFINKNSFLNNQRFAIEVIKPIYEKYNRIQMKQDFKIILGLQYAL